MVIFLHKEKENAGTVISHINLHTQAGLYKALAFAVSNTYKYGGGQLAYYQQLKDMEVSFYKDSVYLSRWLLPPANHANHKNKLT